MKRVDADGAAAEGLFQDKNIETGTPGTEFEATWHNAVQEEICNVIESEGIELDAEDNTQLLQAIDNKVYNESRGIMTISGNYVIPTNDINKYYVDYSGSSAIFVTLPTFSENIGRRITIVKIGTSVRPLYVKTASETEMINGVVRNSTSIFGNNAGIPTGDPGGIVARYHGIVIEIISATQAVVIEHIKPYQKTYRTGLTYNGVSFTISSSTNDAVSGYAIPYQTIDGRWRMKLYAIVDTAASTSENLIFTVVGVTFSDYEPLAVGVSAKNAYTMRFTSNITIVNSVAGTKFFVSGDVEIGSKPTWAD